MVPGNYTGVLYSNQVVLMDPAGREGVSHKARLAGNGVTLFKRRNTVGDPFPARDGWDVPPARPPNTPMRRCRP